MNLKTLITVFMTMSIAISCSNVKFTNAPTSGCEAADTCVVDQSGETRTKLLEVPISNRKVDILFVVDNSRTMIDEQSKIASRLANFISGLNYAGLDWRIAITTTDNKSGSQDYRNGALVPFLSSNDGRGGFTYAQDSSGKKIYYITKSMANYESESLFYNTVSRPESKWCENNRNDCPNMISGDERGIYSAIKNVSKISRTGAQLHVIIISDEDERSNSGKGFDGQPAMPMVDGQDYAGDLIRALKGRNAKVHSIVTLGMSNINSQNFDIDACIANHTRSGEEFVGCNYIRASILTGGIIENKNAGDYSAALRAIANSIVANSISKVEFDCVPSQVTISANGSLGYPNNLTNPQTINPNGQTYYTFNPALGEGMGATVKWFCPRSSL